MESTAAGPDPGVLMQPLEGFIPWPDEVAASYRRAGLWKGRTLARHLDDWVLRYGERTAIVADNERLSYRELGARVSNVASHLVAMGLRPRDRVVLQLHNVPEFFYLSFALYRIGALPVFALPAHRESEIRYLIQFSQAVACAVPLALRGFDYLDMLRRISPETPSLRHVLVAGDVAPAGTVAIGQLAANRDAAGEPMRDDFRPGAADVAFFLLSGGTTGLPKMIPRTHDDYECHFDAAAVLAGVDRESVYLAALPISHNFSYGSPGALGVLSRGGRLVLAPSPSPEATFPLIERERVTIAAQVPAVTIQWLESPLRLRYDLSSLRVLQVGGSRLNAEVAQRVRPLLGATLQQIYGMAEGLVNCTRLDDPDEVVFHTQGRPILPADETRVVDWNGDLAAPGSPGELLTRGPYTIRGYYLAPEHNTRAFTRDGYYRTGDIVRLMPSGNFSVEGRVKDMINRGGEKISAEEVENLILGHPAVQNVAAVAMPDRVLGEKVCAYVITRAGARLALEELRRFMEQKGVSRFKLPERLEIVECFPLTTVGKVSKKALREDVAAKLDAEGLTG